MAETTRMSRTLLLLLLSVLLGSTNVNAYFVGQHVETTVYGAKTGRNEATRAQMPLFGLQTKVSFPRFTDRFSLGFEEGFHALQWIDGKSLQKLKVTFIYSKSGDGRIHSVWGEAVTRGEKDEFSDHQVEVEYNWVEEEPIDINSGTAVMFLATLIVSVIFMFQACGIMDETENRTEVSDPTPKWGLHSE